MPANSRSHRLMQWARCCTASHPRSAYAYRRQSLPNLATRDRSDQTDDPAQSSPAGRAALRALRRSRAHRSPPNTRATSASVTTWPSSRLRVQTIAAGIRPDETGDHVVNTNPGHFLGRLKAVRMARSVSAIAEISPKRTPRDRVVAAPITRNPDWPASEPISPFVQGPAPVKAQHKAGDFGTAHIQESPPHRAASQFCACCACCADCHKDPSYSYCPAFESC